MNPQSEILFAESKQVRSQKTLEDILQAASGIVEDGDTALFTSRTLAERSGYALGTLVDRLGSIESVFLWVIKQTRDRLLKDVALDIAEFDKDMPIEIFAETMVSAAFTNIEKVNPKVMRYFEARTFRREGFKTDYFTYMDFFIDPYLESVQNNKTGTFRPISKDEATLLIRQLCFLVERPFVEGNPIAGTEEHRRVAKEAIIRLLGK